MTSRHLRHRCSVAAGAVAVFAAAAPTAGARPALDPPAHTGARSIAAPAPTVVQSTHGGFEWASGAIGAGGATVVLLLTAGGAVTLSRRHTELPS